MRTWSTDPERLLVELGISGERVGHEIKASCPNHVAHSDGRDEHPSWRIVVDPSHDRCGQHFCHPCGFGGGLVRLISHVTGVSIQEAVQGTGAGPWTGFDPEDPDTCLVNWGTTPMAPTPSRSVSGMPSLPSGCVPILSKHDIPPWAAVYWDRKIGVPIERASFYGCHWGITGRLTDRIVIPAWTGGRLLGYSARAVDFRSMLKELYPKITWPREGGRKEDWAPERSQWVDAITGSCIDPVLASAATAWLGGTTRRPGIRYLTPREQVGSKGQQPELGADMGSALMFWDLVPMRCETVTLVEGAIKAMRLREAGWPGPIGLTGSSGLTAAKRALLGTVPRILYPGDPDKAGHVLLNQLQTKVAGRETEVVEIPLDMPADRIPIDELTRILKNYE